MLAKPFSPLHRKRTRKLLDQGHPSYPTTPTDMNTWEEQALRVRPRAAARRVYNPMIHDPLIYPGLYSPSSLDMLTIFGYIHTRPNPTISLGAVDASCAIVVCDLTRADQPIIYVSEPFTALTGYTPAEVFGRNCRFLQAPPPSVLSPSDAIIPGLLDVNITTGHIHPLHPLHKLLQLQPRQHHNPIIHSHHQHNNSNNNNHNKLPHPQPPSPHQHHQPSRY
ncbi:hypothetical protein B0J18DRAFT_271184 [Chaetomium sp. MPI-SDFR-AT-0129]|nr:hypothetical protein B0J18DRAFT_271184 [Chaetomium sp. MPI-SDFR-AT-0129]